MKALVTGAGSYTGSYLIPYLKSQGVDVVAVSRRAIIGVPCHTIDWNNLESIESALNQERPDYIFHLVGSRNLSPVSRLIEVNALYTANLFQAMARTGLRCPVLIVGSAAEYGNLSEKQLPVNEREETRPISDYGFAKSIQTKIASRARMQGIPVVNARLFNVIGPNPPADLAIGSFCTQLSRNLRGDHVPIQMGNTLAVRDYIDIRDVTEIFWKLIQAPKAYGKTVNVCTGRQSPIEKLLSELKRLCKATVEIQTDGSRTSGPHRIYGDTSLLFDLIGKHSFISQNESLQFIVDGLLAPG